MRRLNFYLASAITGDGFINNFHNISKDHFLYVLKGGPGTGKSTLMKRIGEYFYNKGEDIEYFYCSSDSNSLDGIKICQHNIVVVDGTAPHVTEVQLPLVNGKIVNLGDAIDSQIIQHRDSLEKMLKEKEALYNEVFNYLSISKAAYESTFLLKTNNMNITTTSRKLINKLNLQNFEKKGNCKQLFINYWGKKDKSSFISKNKFENIYYTEGTFIENSKALEIISNHAMSMGFDIIQFMNILTPSFIASIYLPQVNTFISCREKITNEFRPHFEVSKKYQKLACLTLNKIQKTHRNIESFYIENMHFSEIEQITAKLIGDIERRIEEKSSD